MNAPSVEGLRRAIVDTSERGLLSGSKWAADMLTGLKASLKTAAAAQNVARIPPSESGAPARSRSPPLPSSPQFVSPNSLPTDLVSPGQLKDGGRYHGVGTTFPRTADDGRLCLSVPDTQEEMDAYAVARRFFDAKEFERVAFTLGNYDSAQSRFLSYYSQYLAAEKQGLNDFYKKDHTRQQPPVPLNQSLLKILDAIGKTVDPFLLLLKGILFSRVKRRAEALECLVQSINIYPWNWTTWMQLSLCLQDQDEFLGIHKHLPAHVVTRIFSIRFMIELHSPGDAELRGVEELLRYFPGSLYLMTQKALVYYHQRDFETAEKVFDEIRKKDPYRIDDIDVFSNILYVMQKRTKLSKLAHEFLAFNKDRPEVCCVVGNHYSLRVEHEKAVKYFKRAVQLDHTFLSAWTLMGHEFIEMKNSQAAVEAYRRAVAVNRKDYRGWYGLGQAYELLNMHNYALHYYQRGAALRPYDVRMWQAMGMCYQDLNRPREAISCFKRALLGSDARETSLNLKIASLHNQLEERAEAAAYHRRCIELSAAAGRPVSEYVRSCMYVAQYQLIWGGGDGPVARELLEMIATSNTEESSFAVDCLQKLRMTDKVPRPA